MIRSEMSDVHNTLSKTNSQYRLSFPQDELLCFHNIHVQYFQNDKDKLYSGLFISYMARNKDPWCIPTAHAHVGLHPTIATLILKYKCILYHHLFSLVLTHIRHMVMVTILFLFLFLPYDCLLHHIEDYAILIFVWHAQWIVKPKFK